MEADAPSVRKGQSRAERKPWTKEEDDLLQQLVQQHGDDWRAVSEHIPERGPKQCKERWNNQLQPEIKKSKLTKAEWKTVVDLQRKHGNKWSIIAKSLTGRTASQIKNYWHARQRTALKQKDLDFECASDNGSYERKEDEKDDMEVDVYQLQDEPADSIARNWSDSERESMKHFRPLRGSKKPRNRSSSELNSSPTKVSGNKRERYSSSSSADARWTWPRRRKESGSTNSNANSEELEEKQIDKGAHALLELADVAAAKAASDKKRRRRET